MMERNGKERIDLVLAIIGIGVGSVLVIWAAIVSGLMIHGMAERPHDQNDTVIVLGCRVIGEKPSTHLSRRIAAAATYLASHPGANCVASGGKGTGEQISEAACIYRELVAAGISPARICLEEQSVNTAQNLTFSKAILKEKGWKAEVVLVTDGYHQYRAGLLAKRFGISASPVNAKHTWHTFPANYARELLAITKTLLT